MPGGLMNRWQFCPPAKAGAATGAAAGLAAWALVTFVPAWRNGLPQPVLAALPFALGWAGHVIASWATAHKPPVPQAAPGITLPPPGTGNR